MVIPLWGLGLSSFINFCTCRFKGYPQKVCVLYYFIFEAPLLRRGASYMLKCLWLCVCVCGSDFFEVTLNAKFSLISHPIWMTLWIMNLISIFKKSYDTTPNLVPK